MIAAEKKGVYFLANDRVVDLALAFLNSFRLTNPDTPLCLIPYAADYEKLDALSTPYNFTVFSDQDFLNYCDEISLMFHARVSGNYRKLACWQGDFEEFIYVDIDMLVLKNLDFAFPLIQHYDFVVAYSNMPSIVKWVWKDSIYKSGMLSDEQIQYGANLGFLCSRKSALTRPDIDARLSDAKRIQPHMELSTLDQPFLNFMIVSSGKRYTSLYSLLDHPVYPENYVEFWAGNNKRDLLAGVKTMMDGKLREIFLIHWAGCWQARKWEIDLYRLMAILRLRKKMWLLSLHMPRRKLWKRYYHMPLPQ
jgi:hypothetical protein